jgi:uncharacterized membrane protein
MSRFLRLIVAITIGLAREQDQRRRVMFALTLGAVLMLFVGTFVLWNIFTTHPLFFAIYWLVCVWIVICVLLLAIYDLLQNIRRAKREHAAARRDLFKD